MCTAITFKTKDFYFGRTLDHDLSYAEEVTVVPRNVPLPFRSQGTLEHHYAMVGMAHVIEGYPLLFDGVNEKGLAMAGLNFVGYARYRQPEEGRDNVAQFEFVPWILAQCATLQEAKALLDRVNITDEAFSRELPPAQLHWIIADHTGAITVEAVGEGLRVWPNPAGVLTNNPPFDEQLFQLNNYLGLSPKPPHNRFSEVLDLQVYSHGMGALGLPGDPSSQSRFVRAAFTKLNAVCGTTEGESVNQFFHILGAVEQSRGCTDTGSGGYEHTIYTSCCNADKGIYYYTTYENHQITAVYLHRENLEDRFLIRYPLIQGEQIREQN